MIAYKFRREDQIAYVCDIILNRRLYCSSPSALNDPLEGDFSAMILESRERTKQAYLETRQEQSYLSVCSLSMTYEFIPLWAYYASDFTGLAIEVEIPADIPELKQVSYTNSSHLGMLPQDDPSKAACESLCIKREEWRHEQEVRIILDKRSMQTAPYYRLNSPVRCLIVGQRMQPALISTLKILCENQGIRLCQARLGQNGVFLVEIYQPELQ